MKAVWKILILGLCILQIPSSVWGVDLNIAFDTNNQVVVLATGAGRNVITIPGDRLFDSGKYLVLASTHTLPNDAAGRNKIEIRTGATPEIQTQEIVESPAGSTTEWVYNSFRQIRLSGDQNLGLYGEAHLANDTATFDESTLIAIPLDPYIDENVDWWYDENVTTKANMDDVFANNVGARITFTPDGTSDYLVLGSGQITIDAVDDDVARMELSDGTTQYSLSMRDGEDTADIDQQFIMYPLRKPPPTSTTLQLRFQGDAIHDHNSSRLFILRLNAFAAHDFNVVDENLGISSTERTVANVQFTNPTDSNVIALWGGLFKHELGAPATNQVQLRAYIDSNNVIAGASPRLQSWNAQPATTEGADGQHYGIFWNAHPGKDILRTYRSTVTGDTTLGTNQHNNRQATVVVFTTRLAETPPPSTASTVFIFNVVVSSGHTITYGGNCTASAFFYNEMDANHDPDPDGNAARVKPRPTRFDFTVAKQDVNYLGITNPSTTHVAHARGYPDKPPADNNIPFNEFSTGEYDEIEADDASIFAHSFANDVNFPTVRMVFKPPFHEQKIRDLNFFMVGNSGEMSTILTCGVNNVSPGDLNVYAWNYTQNEYEQVASWDNTGLVGFAAKELEALITENVHEYISTDGNVTILLQGIMRTSGSNKTCISIDYVDLNVTYYPTSTDFCQSSTLSPFTITNTGGTATNVDANFTNAFTGVDLNIVLKAWMGNGTGCGADGNGLGGWEKDCSVSGTTTPVTATTCKQWNSTNATTLSRLVTSLGAGDTNQICFSGDFNGFVPAGDHNGSYNTTS